MNEEYEDNGYPCNDCSSKDYCDGWEAQLSKSKEES